ncbi:MAG: phosphoserine transaminase [Proteobacteria bacterium]|nr:phosphoserine transaminase [Pseudomonadota bacterium]NOG59880.1 phosphoserine transaminase [Pseudomonadota bacterium]
MNTTATRLCEKPVVRPDDPRFSSGPCKKHPGWNLSGFPVNNLGRSHRASKPKYRLEDVINRSASTLGLPDDWLLGIVPASDTGAFELALWSMLGQRGVDVFVWESFSNDWADDIQNQLQIEDLNIFKADYGDLPDLTVTKTDRDIVFVFNGTTSGVRVPNMDWVASEREGVVFCDATSAAFAMELDYEKLDVVTWSWQKVLGSEGGFGMLALSPRAVQRLEEYQPPRPLPKIFRLIKKGKVDRAIFNGATINTPSMLAVEDSLSALSWAESIGGLSSLIKRCDDNFNVVNEWVKKSNWIDWLPNDPATYSTTSMCLKIVDEKFTSLSTDEQNAAIKTMCQWLEEEGVAYDIAAYRSAPPGFRLWGGATIEKSDLEKLLPWFDWAYQHWLENEFVKENLK